jgi:hypothetical protein
VPNEESSSKAGRMAGYRRFLQVNDSFDIKTGHSVKLADDCDPRKGGGDCLLAITVLAVKPEI